jgi:hypothetical protein
MLNEQETKALASNATHQLGSICKISSPERQKVAKVIEDTIKLALAKATAKQQRE